MADYIPQPDMSLPSFGGRTISHNVETFSATDPAVLDDDVNAFFDQLKTTPNITPIIRHVNFSTAQSGTLLTYMTQIHYVLVQ